MIHPMTNTTRYVLSLACLLLLLALVPPQPAYSNGDPDEVVERMPPSPPLPGFPGQWPTPGCLDGDPDELLETEFINGYPTDDSEWMGGYPPGQPWLLAMRALWIAWTSMP